MTGLALHLSGPYVMGVIEINVVGQVVYFNPLDRFCFGRIPRLSIIRIKPSIFIKFSDLSCTIYFLAIFIMQRIAIVFFNGLVAVHTNIYRRNSCMLAFPCIAMAIKAVDLVYTRMYFM